MSPFMKSSKKSCTNNENSLKFVDFVDNYGYFTAFCSISCHKRVKMSTLKKRNSSFLKK